MAGLRRTAVTQLEHASIKMGRKRAESYVPLQGTSLDKQPSVPFISVSMVDSGTFSCPEKE